MSHIQVRLASPADAIALHRIINEAYRTSKSWTNEVELVGGERMSLMDLEARLESLHSQPALDDPLFVAEIDRSVVGCIEAELPHNHADMNLRSDGALLGLLAVDPKRQSGGIGKTLVKHVIGYLTQNPSMQVAIMWVLHKRIDIQAWYERLGFKFTGDTRPFVLPALALQKETYFKVYELSLHSR